MTRLDVKQRTACESPERVAVRPAFLSGLGVSLPNQVLTNDDLAARFGDIDAAGIEKRTGIRRRYIAGEGQRTSDLAVAAARNALEQSGTSPGALELIVVATVSPDQLMPATACRVQHALGASRAAAFDLAAACSGFVYGLWVGQQFIESGQASAVLVIGAETASRIIDPHDAGCAMLFGDAAGAAVLTAADGPYRLGRFVAATHGEQYAHLIREGGSEKPLSPELLAARGQFVQMDGRRVFRAAVEGFSQTIVDAAEANELELGEIDWIVPHQANVRIFGEVAQRLKLPLEKFWLNLAEHGNTVAASVPVALEELHREQGAVPGSKLLLAAVGAGMCSGGTVLFGE